MSLTIHEMLSAHDSHRTFFSNRSRRPQRRICSISSAFAGVGRRREPMNLPKTSFRPPWTTSLTKPISFASCAENFRPVRASSLAFESLPMTFGKRCKVPMSAARPTLTSCADQCVVIWLCGDVRLWRRRHRWRRIEHHRPLRCRWRDPCKRRGAPR